MKFQIRNPYIVRAFLISLMVTTVGLFGCSSSGSRTLGQKWSDSQVKRDVKKQLASDPLFKYPDVRADVHDGNVQLSGYVGTAEQRLRAAELASNTKGVRQVINHIMIQPTPTGPAKIHDPFGHDPDRLMVDTNAAPVHLRNLPSPSTNSVP